MTNPDISIVSVVLNDVEGLRKTIESIERQVNINIEHIIVDGGSGDGSEVLARLHSAVKLESKLDGGIYQGMQRGADKATSPLLMFVNSSDVLNGDNHLGQSVKLMLDSNALWGYGPIIENTLRSTTRINSASGKPTLQNISNRFTFIPFPTTIMQSNEFRKVGGFRFDYKIAGDFDLIIRLAKESTPIRWDIPLVRFSAGGVSYTKPVLAWYEEHLIRVRNLDLKRFQVVTSYLILLRRILRWVSGKILDQLQKIGLLGKTNWRDRI
jgi:GT2 family glycosyltransferase